jgi:hypothetical protein
MNKRIQLFILILLGISPILSSQSLLDLHSGSGNQDSFKLKGSARAGFYINELSDNPTLSTGFSDINLKISSEDGYSYKAVADFRIRYGMEFGSPVNDYSINEAYVAWYNRWVEISAGQQIIKWSNSDFFRSQDRINPRNDILRTLDDTDRDLGNVMMRMNLYPNQNLNLEILYLPFQKPSVLSTEIMEIPSFVNIGYLPELRLNNNGSWAINLGFNLRNADIGLSWYKGSNPLPMIYYDTLIVQQQNGELTGEVRLESELYNISMFAANLELVAGKTILRGELTYIDSDKSGPNKEYIPFSELLWTAGIEPSMGNLRFLFEYQGKYVIDFIESSTDPVFPETFDLPPGVTPEIMQETLTQQISSFNRLYNYQLNRYNHSFAFRVAYDNSISLFNPELNMLFNATTNDLMINPLIRIKPSDNFSITVGSEIFRGLDNSLYELLETQLTSIYLGLMINF